MVSCRWLAASGRSSDSGQDAFQGATLAGVWCRQRHAGIRRHAKTLLHPLNTPRRRTRKMVNKKATFHTSQSSLFTCNASTAASNHDAVGWRMAARARQVLPVTTTSAATEPAA